MKSGVFLNFRSKLLLAMVGVVVGVTGATLYVTQQLSEESLEDALEKLTRLNVAHFRDVQTERHRNARAKCYSFSRSVRLRQIMLRYLEAVENQDKEDLQAVTEILYLTAEDELRELLRADEMNPDALKSAFFRFVGAKNEVLNPPDGTGAGFLQGDGNKYLQETLSSVSASMPGNQEVGFLAPPKRDGLRTLVSVVITKIVDVRFDETLGSLAIAFPVPEYAEPRAGDGHDAGAGATALTSRGDTVRAGVWLADEFFVKEIEPSIRTNLARMLGQHLSSTRASEHDFSATLNDEPYRVFHQELQPGPNFPAAFQVLVYSLKEKLALQRASRLKVLSVGGAGLLFAFGLSLYLSHGLSVPIQELVTGTGEIQRGNYSVKVAVRSRDEVGRLAGAFNEMADGLALKEKYRSVLDKVSDKAVAEELMQGNVKLGGETREVSVLFCDIRGFTALTQGMDPDEIIRMLNEHFTPLTRVVAEHSGVVDKFVGDLIMAIFGAPKSYGHDAYNAARCAFEMIREREKLNKSSRYKIEVGIGVASGPALAGNMGSSDRLNYTVLGERVNLASRLCSKAGRNEVVIDDTTKKQANEWIAVEPLDKLSLKGFSNPVQAYKLLDVHPRNGCV